MSRALVLGGGGPVGIGWEAGLVVGLHGAGVSLTEADLIVGTSAGSVVGAQLAGGADLAAAVELLAASTGEVDPEANQAAVEGLQQLTAIVAEGVAGGGSNDELRARLGRLALDAPTIPEEEFLQLFTVLAGGLWPDRFACTAVDTATGAFRVWDQAAGVELSRAVASSCSVPSIYPPVAIDGARYMDGGMRDMLNADVAAGHDTVLAVSCVLLQLPEGFGDPTLDAVLAGSRAQLDGLRDGGSKVETITPGDEFLEVSGWGLNLMDFTKAAAAFEAGVRQGAVEASRLAGFWAA
jgi:NTE family protein